MIIINVDVMLAKRKIKVGELKTLENLNNGQINQCNSVEVGSSSSLGLADKLWLSGSAEMQIHMLRDGWRRCSGFSHVPQGPSMFGWKN